MGAQAAAKLRFVIIQIRWRLAVRDAKAADRVPHAFLGGEAGVLDRFLKRTAKGGGEVADGHASHLRNHRALGQGFQDSLPNLAKPLMKFFLRLEHRSREEDRLRFRFQQRSGGREAHPRSAPARPWTCSPIPTGPRCESVTAIVCGVSTVGLVTFRSPHSWRIAYFCSGESLLQVGSSASRCSPFCHAAFQSAWAELSFARRVSAAAEISGGTGSGSA